MHLGQKGNNDPKELRTLDFLGLNQDYHVDVTVATQQAIA